MGIFSKKDDKKAVDPVTLDKSVYVSDARIDRAGNGWKRKSLWIRQEHLGKLKALGHFEGKTVPELLDRALSEFLAKEWDDSRAMKLVVGKSIKKKTVNI